MIRSIPLGDSSLKGSVLSYGCWRLAGSAPGPEVSPDREAHGREAVLAAFEAGYTVFDLADIYAEGAAERIFGQALALAPAMRDQITLVTKCGIRRKGEPHADSPYRYDSSAEHIIESCEGSLRRLNVGTIDLLLLHRPDFLMQPEEIAAAFSKLKEQGKARFFGVSNFSPSQVALLRKACPLPLVAHQVEISLLQLERFHDGTLDQCQAERITPMAWSALAAGRLSTSTPIELHDPHHARRLRIRENLEMIARDYGVSRGLVALAWLLKHPAGIVPIVGTTQPERIKEYASAADLHLSRDEWYLLMESAHGHRLA